MISRSIAENQTWAVSRILFFALWHLCAFALRFLQRDAGAGVLKWRAATRQSAAILNSVTGGLPTRRYGAEVFVLVY